ncbi:hypothetical protein VC83_00478 [Pseudogymnoascus destructans]|uniref:Uncharacterized protein n=2 Tax=Pseudogymnoascus destructans TaxID=655981 RepID=L8GBX6_PSED2|nr:uncharacterized protein VC83_00478 [Pseudogymnoascus destructans]ELR10389.1 hypothetical protein GMDG_00802 [Pseudogymnoascus destructans 20631-21]OAF63093.1 hypothetical protein VC83_00478 [Pseudogymnoascus destructans]
MSTAIAMAPSPAPHDRNAYVDIAPSNSSPRQTRIAAPSASNHHEPRSESTSPRGSSGSKSSPTSLRNAPPPKIIPPKIIVKKEPASPGLPTSRHRPRKLDLSKNNSSAANSNQKGTAPLTSRETGGLAIQDVGLACLSPGFVTHDPTMREQLQRSISVREQQRHIIESRLQQTGRPGDAPLDSAKEMPGPSAFGSMKTPGTSRRKAPPGLSIVAPSHEQFANERVIQSAPLNQTFTGRHQPHPLTRHVQNQPSNLSNTSHIHHVPATQTANRLPPISDVFAAENLGQHRDAANNGPKTSIYPPSSNAASHHNRHTGFPSPTHAAQQQPPHSARPREYRSAEEAQVELAGGRPELIPKIVHYGGHQPPTPPSPQTGNAMRNGGAGRRRGREEYEEGRSPPLGQGPAAARRTAAGVSGAFGEGRDSEEAVRAKKEEFLRLCDRAWDLFHL